MALPAGASERWEPSSVREYAGECAAHYAGVYLVPLDLVEAVIDVESSWRADVVSPKGAVGLMQLMPGTAFAFGVRNRFWIADNIRGGVAYLAWLMHAFNGDLRLVVAAYAAGENRILRRRLEYASPEVYEYVSRVAARYRARKLLSASRR